MAADKAVYRLNLIDLLDLDGIGRFCANKLNVNCGIALLSKHASPYVAIGHGLSLDLDRARSQPSSL